MPRTGADGPVDLLAIAALCAAGGGVLIYRRRTSVE
ncbi:LPXTG cell wall anchor domain-containing protein [Propionimicrobium sp. BV2F7]